MTTASHSSPLTGKELDARRLLGTYDGRESQYDDLVGTRGLGIWEYTLTRFTIAGVTEEEVQATFGKPPAPLTAWLTHSFLPAPTARRLVLVVAVSILKKQIYALTPA